MRTGTKPGETARQTRAQRTLNDPRWALLTARNPAARAAFVYSVRTTGVYCRPSCKARRARPENVCFHDDGADAERAGFRPCRRCRPERIADPRDSATAENVARATRA